MNTNTQLSSEVKSILTTAFAQGKCNQQAFTLVRNKGFSITYQQVQQHRVSTDDTFNNAFNAVFCQ